MTNEELAKIETATLERAKIACQAMFSAELLDSMQVRLVPSYLGDGVLCRLVVDVFRNKSGLPQEIVATEYVPADWWQHFKKRWFPTWALSRWPVISRGITTKVKRFPVCPHAPIAKGVDLIEVPAMRHFDFLIGKEDE